MAPLVEVSTTLHDLYSLDGGNSEDVALVYAFPHTSSLAASVPVSVKYAYMAPRVPKLGPDTMARFCLGCMAQYYGFVAGPMDLHLFDVDKTKLEVAYDSLSWNKTVLTHRVDAQRVFDGLESCQRPRLHFVENAKQLATVNKKKAVITPVDFLEGKDPLVNQDAHWDLLSKRTLALSELPSPPTQVIDSVLGPGQTSDASLVEDEMARQLRPIEEHRLPFVVKLPMGLGGHAVFMVRDEEKRQNCLEVLREALPTMYAMITADNETSQPASLLLQEVVPGTSAGVSFFVTKAGRPVYISCSEQTLDERDYWAGGFMDYSRQEALSEQYGAVLRQVAEYVYARGYYGPLGIDVMTDESGRQMVVDMNIRQTGSYTLGLMKKHFWEQRQLPIGGLLCPLAVRGDRDQFEEKFSREIEDGTLVIASWCRGKGGPGGMFVYSVCGLLMAGDSRESLGDLLEKLQSMSIKK